MQAPAQPTVAAQLHQLLSHQRTWLAHTADEAAARRIRRRRVLHAAGSTFQADDGTANNINATTRRNGRLTPAVRRLVNPISSDATLRAMTAGSLSAPSATMSTAMATAVASLPAEPDAHTVFSALAVRAEIRHAFPTVACASAVGLHRDGVIQPAWSHFPTMSQLCATDCDDNGLRLSSAEGQAPTTTSMRASVNFHSTLHDAPHSSGSDSASDSADDDDIGMDFLLLPMSAAAALSAGAACQPAAAVAATTSAPDADVASPLGAELASNAPQEPPASRAATPPPPTAAAPRSFRLNLGATGSARPTPSAPPPVRGRAFKLSTAASSSAPPAAAVVSGAGDSADVPASGVASVPTQIERQVRPSGCFLLVDVQHATTAALDTTPVADRILAASAAPNLTSLSSTHALTRASAQRLDASKQGAHPTEAQRRRMHRASAARHNDAFAATVSSMLTVFQHLNQTDDALVHGGTDRPTDGTAAAEAQDAETAAAALAAACQLADSRRRKAQSVEVDVARGIAAALLVPFARRFIVLRTLQVFRRVAVAARRRAAAGRSGAAVAAHDEGARVTIDDDDYDDGLPRDEFGPLPPPSETGHRLMDALARGVPLMDVARAALPLVSGFSLLSLRPTVDPVTPLVEGGENNAGAEAEDSARAVADLLVQVLGDLGDVCDLRLVTADCSSHRNQDPVGELPVDETTGADAVTAPPPRPAVVARNVAFRFWPLVPHAPDTPDVTCPEDAAEAAIDVFVDIERQLLAPSISAGTSAAEDGAADAPTTAVDATATVLASLKLEDQAESGQLDLADRLAHLAAVAPLVATVRARVSIDALRAFAVLQRGALLWAREPAPELSALVEERAGNGSEHADLAMGPSAAGGEEVELIVEDEEGNPVRLTRRRPVAGPILSAAELRRSSVKTAKNSVTVVNGDVDFNVPWGLIGRISRATFRSSIFGEAPGGAAAASVSAGVGRSPLSGPTHLATLTHVSDLASCIVHAGHSHQLPSPSSPTRLSFFHPELAPIAAVYRPDLLQQARNSTDSAAHALRQAHAIRSLPVGVKTRFEAGVLPMMLPLLGPGFDEVERRDIARAAALARLGDAAARSVAQEGAEANGKTLTAAGRRRARGEDKPTDQVGDGGAVAGGPVPNSPQTACVAFAESFRVFEVPWAVVGRAVRHALLLRELLLQAFRPFLDTACAEADDLLRLNGIDIDAKLTAALEASAAVPADGALHLLGDADGGDPGRLAQARCGTALATFNETLQRTLVDPLFTTGVVAVFQMQNTFATAVVSLLDTWIDLLRRGALAAAREERRREEGDRVPPSHETSSVRIRLPSILATHLLYPATTTSSTLNGGGGGRSQQSPLDSAPLTSPHPATPADAVGDSDRRTPHVQLRDAIVLSGIWECVSADDAAAAAAAFIPPPASSRDDHEEDDKATATLKDERVHAARVAAFADWVASWDGTSYQQWVADAIAAAACEDGGAANPVLPEAPPIPATVAELVPLAAAVREFTLRAAVVAAKDPAAGPAGAFELAGDCPPAFLEPHEAAAVAAAGAEAVARAADGYQNACAAWAQAAGGKQQQGQRSPLSPSTVTAIGLLEEDDDVALVPRVFVL